MMGGGRTRKVEKGVLGGSPSGGLSSGCGSLNVPTGPVFYPSEEEFKDPLEYIYKIRQEAEPYGICKIVPPRSWKPPFALDRDSFTFPTKSQAIHQLQARCAPCDPKTFRLEYNRFLEEHCGKKAKKRVVFEGEDLDLCKLFNAVKRFGGYDNAVKVKKWAEVFRFIRPGRKISECSKHVLSQLYREHLFDYEEYYCRLNKVNNKSCKRGMSGWKKCEPDVEVSSVKRRRKTKRVRGLKCNKGWHIYCLSPPLKKIPPGNWYCLECLNSEKESFGFVPGKQYSLEAFRRVADRVKKKWFGSAATSWVQLEKKFWEIVEGSVGEVEVMYGSDLDTSVYGSGFPRQIDQRPPLVEVDAWNEYCASPWNLNNLPRLHGSMLRAVHQNIAGVMVPWLYIGMLFSSFCWHFEDHCFYSMNYLHWESQSVGTVSLVMKPMLLKSLWERDQLLVFLRGGTNILSLLDLVDRLMACFEVMRSSLPDLFEAQPDLLFQLVTMLNPSVLQEKGVPVYSIIQEPGNFVITFPRSYHGGFNFGKQRMAYCLLPSVGFKSHSNGLNCAEAVNFAPADWLPHGGFGAELYRHYHKVPVLSHEELLCAVAKSELDSRVSKYLKKELLRIYNNEKTWRERLWRNGIIRSSAMTPRVKPEYVGTEEDPVCVICQQLLYLSAVSCNCRPSAYVCLEHWEHLCECKPNKLCLLYRHTLEELSCLLFKVDKYYSVEAAGDSRKDTSSEKAVALTKKVKGGHVTHLQLAEEWILRSCKILEHPYSRHAYVSAIEEAEQFLWAGSEMDLVREMQNNLIQAQNWANAVRDCLFKVKLWSSYRNCDTERVQMDDVNELLRFSTAPCNEPGHLQLKEYQEEANKLIQEINSALTLCSEYSVADLEILYLKTVDSPIYIKESEKLKVKLSAVKVWLDNVRNCISQKAASSVEVDMLYKLESEILELQFQLPEADLLTDLVRQVKSCRSRCTEIMKDLVRLKVVLADTFISARATDVELFLLKAIPSFAQEVKLFLIEWEGFPVKIPELELLKKYYSDTISWISRVDRVLMNVHEREDQEKVVDELTCIQRDGLLLQIQVDELPRVELELNKARCRLKAFKALRCQMSMDFIQQLMSEATILQIEKEKLFTDISERHAVAMCWEEKAKHVLATRRLNMNSFRASEHIGIIPPSLLAVKLAVSTAKTWLTKSKPFLSHTSSILLASDSCLQVDVLKELVLESTDLNVHCEECSLLEKLLKKSVEWEQDASTLLQNAENLWNSDIIGDVITSSLIPRLECQVLSMETAIKGGISLGLEFNMIPKLQDACSTSKWCIKALSFSTIIPTRKEVEMMLDAAASLPLINKSSTLWTALIDGLSWLKKSLEILDPNNQGQFQVSSVEELFLLSKKICISFPMIIDRLQDAVHNHNLWREQVHLFFELSFEDRSWDMLLQLKEHGSSHAFSCVELEKVLFEHEKVQKWKQRCEDIIKPSPAGEKSLLSALIELKNNLERSFEVYRQVCFVGPFLLNSSALKHGNGCCAETSLEDTVLMVCPYCSFISSSKLTRGGCGSLRTGKKHLALDKLTILLSDANDLCLWTDERRILHQIVEKALACNACLTELVNFALAYVSKDLNVVTQKIRIALKAMDVAGICDDEGNRKFELSLARNPAAVAGKHEGLRDGGMLGLDKVFELISEGESLPVYCGKELKVTKSNVCAVTARPKHALLHLPRPFTGSKFEEPQTPLRRSEFKRNSQKPTSGSKKILVAMDTNDCLRKFSSSERLLWRNRKPFRRAARKRSELQNLSPFFYVHNK
ncbi:hypothetical protein DH2020_036227 [Rehmannia glutinosa]|uniref:Uncharacterized protein n=1 Tax=Rehmannia glutinosa TaxID=99300 RepID=A0ABR0V548_REHGL